LVCFGCVHMRFAMGDEVIDWWFIAKRRNAPIVERG